MNDSEMMFTVSKEELEDMKNNSYFQTARSLVDEIYEEYDEFISEAKTEEIPLRSVKDLKRDRLTCCIVEIAERIAGDIVDKRIESLSKELSK